MAENLTVFDRVLANTHCGCGSVCGRGRAVAGSGAVGDYGGAVGDYGDDGGVGDSGERADGDE